MSTLVPLGTLTQWGNVASVASIEGERYYFIVDKWGSVAMLPASTVEAAREGAQAIAAEIPQPEGRGIGAESAVAVISDAPNTSH